MKSFLVLFFTINNLLLCSQVIQGRVIDAISGESIPFALVTAVDLNLSTKTDLSGEFAFNISVPQSISLKVSAPTYDEEVFIFRVEEIENKVLSLVLQPCHLDVQEVHVVQTKAHVQKEIVSHIELKRLEELNVIQSDHLSNSLKVIPGIYTSSSSSGNAKPVIRGLSGSRVVSYWNGLRIENQQWGSDHGMGITSLGVDRVEIVKGPASVIYGTDAIGGVLIVSDESYAKLNSVESYLVSKVESNTKGIDSQFGVKMSKGNLRTSLYLSHFDNGDYQMGNGYYLVNTRAKGMAGKFLLGYSKGNWVSNLKYFTSEQWNGIPGDEDSTNTGIPYTSSNFARFKTFPAQKITNHFSQWENKFFFKKSSLNLLMGNTNNRLGELVEQNANPEMAVNLNNSFYHVKWKRALGEKHEITVGAQGQYQLNENDDLAEEQLIPDAILIDNGAYFHWTGEFKKWTLQSALRSDLRSIETKNTDFDFKGNYWTTNYSVGAVRTGTMTTLRVNLSSGARSPNTSELLSDGVHEGSLRYEIGQVNLKPELAHQMDVSYEFENEHFNVVLNPFYTLIKDMILLDPQAYSIDGHQVFVYVQKSLVSLAGLDLSWHVHPHFAHGLHLEGSFSTLMAEDGEGENLALIPQSRVLQMLRYDFKENSKFYIKNVALQYSHYFNQPRVTSYELETRGYDLIDVAINARWNILTPLDICAGIRNATNSLYIDHLSPIKNLSLYQPGWSLYFSVKINIEHSLKSGNSSN